ncbi:MAG: hypothetical protein HYW48_08720 [Deltaproteobacteria bacterium]|nr:hypothetical protein [Deltaproteobacteria bacterium]
MPIGFSTALILLFLGAAKLFAQPSPSEKPLTIGVSDEFFDMHPIGPTRKGKDSLLALCLRALLGVDEAGHLRPVLAKGLPVLKSHIIGGEARTMLEFDLSPQAIFGDGSPVTGLDVRFSWTVGKAQGVEPYSLIEDVWILETQPERVRFLLARGTSANILWQLAGFRVVRAKNEAPLLGKDYGNKTLYRTLPTLPDLYNGPYVVKEFEVGRHILFSRNPYFGGKVPEFAEIKVILEPDPLLLEKMLKQGDMQVALSDSFSSEQLSNWEEKALKESPPLRVYQRPTAVSERVDFNHTHPLLGDVRIRRALSLSLDRTQLRDEIYPDRRLPAFSFLPGVSMTVQPSGLKLEKAKLIMKNLGWKQGKDGFLIRKGKPLSLPLAVDTQDKFRNKLAERLKQQWAKLGVDIQIKKLPAQEFFDLVKKARFSALALYAQLSPDLSRLSTQLASSSIPSRDNFYVGENYGRFANKGIDQLLTQYDQEWNLTRREYLLGELEEKFQEALPFLPIFFRYETAVVTSTACGKEVVWRKLRSWFPQETLEIDWLRAIFLCP